MTRSLKGARISAAKKGVPQLARDADTITMQQAVAETGLSELVIRYRAVEAPEGERLRHAVVARPGRQPNSILFNRQELHADLARFVCSSPGCTSLAPGRSGRCGAHAAGVKRPTERLSCRICGSDLGNVPGSWIAEGKGKVCGPCDRGGDRAARLRSRRATDPRIGGAHLQGGEAALEHYRQVETQIEAEGLLLTATVAERTATSAAVIRLHAGDLIPADLRDVGGVKRLVFPANAPDVYARRWALRSLVDEESWKRRERRLDPRFGVRQQRRAVAKLMCGGLGEAEAEAAVASRIRARRRVFLPHRHGAGTKAELHGSWRRLFYELRRQIALGWSDWQVCTAVADEHIRLSPGSWPKYVLAAHGGLRDEDEERATARVWKAIR